MRGISVPQVRRKFGFATHMRQTFAIASTSFAAIAKSATGLVLWAPIAMLVGLLMPELVKLGGVPLLPRTAPVLTVVTAPRFWQFTASLGLDPAAHRVLRR